MANLLETVTYLKDMVRKQERRLRDLEAKVAAHEQSQEQDVMSEDDTGSEDSTRSDDDDGSHVGTQQEEEVVKDRQDGGEQGQVTSDLPQVEVTAASSGDDNGEE